MSVRLPDEAWRELDAVATEHGIGVSEHARAVLLESLDRGDARLGVDLSSQATVPEQLTTVERHTLATLHRILARLVEAPSTVDQTRDPELKFDLERDGDQADQLQQARILEQGWVIEYPRVFNEVITELPRRDSGFVLDVLDMFRFVGASLDRLPADQRAALGNSAASALSFSGFDGNDSYESALLTYARDLIRRGKWSMLADHFQQRFPHDGGNSHRPMVAVYRRMLEVFTPIWRDKIRSASGEPGSFDLSREELAKVAAASVHPSRRV